MDRAGHDLLIALTRDLLDEAEWVPAVLRHGAEAAPGRLGAYIQAQGVSNPSDFQLPEPILHPFDRPRVLVVGLNPNYGPGEEIPRFGSTKEDYVDFYANRFAIDRRDDLGRPALKRLESENLLAIGHYSKVERLLEESLKSRFPLGEQAVYCDAIPWKWKKASMPAYGKVDAAIAYHRLEGIVMALHPQAVLTLGEKSAKVVGDWTKGSPFPNDRNNGNWPVWHVASYHPDAKYGKFNEHREEVRLALEGALARGSK